MPSYKLTYFNLAALAEPIRWAFKVAEVDFEDERIEVEDWPTQKKSGRFPTENLPLLEIDGEVYTQSSAILRYLGSLFGLTVDDPLLRLRLDQTLDILADARQTFRAWFLENDPEKKEVIRQELANEKLPMYLKQIEGIAAKTDGDYIAGSKLTYGDLALAHTINLWLSLALVDEKGLAEKYPAISKQRQAVVNVPQIKEWIEARPKTRF